MSAKTEPYTPVQVWEISPKRLKEAMDRVGMTQSALAAAVGVRQPSIGRLLSGETRTTRALDDIARALKTTPAYLIDEEIDPGAELPSRAMRKSEMMQELGIVGVRELDLTLGMGATYLDVPVTETVRYFDQGWLRDYAQTAPENLIFAQGVGDSMDPTIREMDLLLIDCSKKVITMTDKIWAIAYANCGAVKRLRPRPDGSVEMISDNPLVPNDVAYDGELHVLGQIVAIVRRM